MKVPLHIVPVVIVLCTLAGIYASGFFAIPSFTRTYYEAPEHNVATVTLLVEGVFCVDTARLASNALESMNGVYDFTAYASRNKLDIRFDPTRTTPDRIALAIEGPIYDDGTGEYLFRLFRVIEVDNRKRDA